MTCFYTAVKNLLKEEGGYVDHPKDPGGATKYGISSRFLNKYLQSHPLKDKLDLDDDGDISKFEIESLSEEMAEKIYYEFWWRKYKYGNIANQEIANKILSLSVHIGPSGAHKILQESVNQESGYRVRLAVDGILGNKSFTSINIVDPEALLPIITSLQLKYYQSLNNDGLSAFQDGWRNRACNKTK